MVPLGLSRDTLRGPGRDRSALLRIKWSLLRDKAVGPKSLLHVRAPSSARPAR